MASNRSPKHCTVSSHKAIQSLADIYMMRHREAVIYLSVVGVWASGVVEEPDREC